MNLRRVSAMKKKEPTIDELYKALDELGFKYEHSESHEGLEVVNFLVTPTDEDEENEDEN
jgi:signal recognition particle subunit SEC65